MRVSIPEAKRGSKWGKELKKLYLEFRVQDLEFRVNSEP
jgi:hypothetical protein